MSDASWPLYSLDNFPPFFYNQARTEETGWLADFFPPSQTTMTEDQNPLIIYAATLGSSFILQLAEG